MAGKKSLAEMKPQAKNDAYTVMLTISLVAMIAACILLAQELKRYPTLLPGKSMTVPPPTISMPGTDGGNVPVPRDPDAQPAPKDNKPEGGAEAKPATPPENKNP